MMLPGAMNQAEPGKPMALEVGTTWNASASGTLTQQLFNQSVFTGLQAARSGEEYYALQTQQTKEDVIYNVSALYYGLLVRKEKLSVIQSNIDKMTKLVETTQSQLDNGLAKRIDLDRIKVNLVNFQTQKTQLINMLKVDENTLKTLLGMPVSEVIEFPAMALSDIEQKAAVTQDFGSFNLENRTEFKVLKKTEELQQFQKKAYVSEYFPQLSFNAQYSYNGLSDKFDLFKGGNTTAQWFGMANIGLTLKIPIFDGFARRSRVNQADLTLQQIGKQLELNKLNLTTQFENARLNLLNSLTTIKTQRKT